MHWLLICSVILKQFTFFDCWNASWSVSSWSFPLKPFDFVKLISCLMLSISYWWLLYFDYGFIQITFYSPKWSLSDELQLHCYATFLMVTVIRYDGIQSSSHSGCEVSRLSSVSVVGWYSMANLKLHWNYCLVATQYMHVMICEASILIQHSHR